MTKSIRRAAGLSPILFALAFGAYAQDAKMDHSAHGAAATEQSDTPADPPAAESAGGAQTAFEGYTDAMMSMHENMAMESTGNADADFVIGMIPHHQAAVDMAEIVLEHGSDPEIRKLAEEVISAQQKEIEVMEAWLKKNGYEMPTAGMPTDAE